MAIELASQAKHKEALDAIGKIETYRKRLPCEYQLLKATLLHRLGRLEEAFESYWIALRLADNEKGWGYTNAVRSYLKCYAAANIAGLQRLFPASGHPPLRPTSPLYRSKKFRGRSVRSFRFQIIPIGSH